MLTSRDISLSPRLLALLITVAALAAAFGLSVLFSRAKITVSSATPGALVFTDKNTEPKSLPQTYSLKTGRYEVTVVSGGYSTETEKITLYPFTHRKLNINLKKSVDPRTLPLYSKVPFDSEEFSISEANESGVYTITLYPIINDESDLKNYSPQLKQLGQKAQAWIVSQGVKPESIKVEWLPQKPDGISFGVSAPSED